MAENSRVDHEASQVARYGSIGDEKCNKKCRRYMRERPTPWIATLCGLTKGLTEEGARHRSPEGTFRWVGEVERLLSSRDATHQRNQFTATALVTNSNTSPIAEHNRHRYRGVGG